MSARRAAPAAPPRGFSLVELIIALSVMGVVLVAVFSTFFRSNRVGQTMSAAVNQRQGARGACQLLERELRMAGSGWGRLAVNRYRNVSGTGVMDSVFAMNFGYGGATACDSISLMGGWSAASTLSDSTGPSLPTSIKVTSGTGFSIGNLIVVTNGLRAHLFQVTAKSSGSPATLTLSSSSNYNPPSGTLASDWNWPATGYPKASQVYVVSNVSYAMDSTSFPKPSLVRRELGGASQLIAYDIAGFEIRYRMQDNTTTRDPSDIDMVDEVVPMIWTSLSAPGHAAIQDSVWAVVRPRTF